MNNFAQLYMRLAERAVSKGEYPMNLKEFADSQFMYDGYFDGCFVDSLFTFLRKRGWVLLKENDNVPFYECSIFYKENFLKNPFKKAIFDLVVAKNKE